MKILISLLPLFLINISLLAQFDRINVDPVSKNPSYVGSINKNRIVLRGRSFRSGSNANASFDFFSKKLKGGWGISMQQNSADTLINPKYQEYNLAYSPKLTFNNTGVTWAPGIKVSYHRDIVSEEIKQLGAVNAHGLGVTLGFNRNSEKSLIGGYAEFNPSGKWAEYALNCAYKFDKNKLNKVSSTFYISPQYHYGYKRDFSNNNYDIGTKYLNDRWSFARADFGNTYSNSIGSNDDKSYLDILLSYSFRISRFNITLENRHELSPTNDKLFWYKIPNIKVGYKVDKLEVLLDVFKYTEAYAYIDLGIIYKFGKSDK